MVNENFTVGRWPGRKSLQRGQVSRLVTIDGTGADRRIVIETDKLIEAPNWTPDGRWLIVNREGLLYRIAADGRGEFERIETGCIADCNNDHVLSFDGATMYFSAAGHIYAVPSHGGQPRRISNDHSPQSYSYWLHGVSPDGAQLAYVAVEMEDGKRLRHIARIPSTGGADTPLTPRDVPADGPEYSRDGRWIYFNSEQNSTIPGHSQIFRMRPDGCEATQLTFDERVNWFPHPSPDGRCFIYLSYAPGTQGHPADIDVFIRMLPMDGGIPTDVVALFGGQGTLNVNSWAPDSQRFAYVEYPPVR